MSFKTCNESGNSYGDVLYWQDPLPSIGESMDLEHSSIKFMNNTLPKKRSDLCRMHKTQSNCNNEEGTALKETLVVESIDPAALSPMVILNSECGKEGKDAINTSSRELQIPCDDRCSCVINHKEPSLNKLHRDVERKLEISSQNHEAESKLKCNRSKDFSVRVDKSDFGAEEDEAQSLSELDQSRNIPSDSVDLNSNNNNCNTGNSLDSKLKLCCSEESLTSNGVDNSCAEEKGETTLLKRQKKLFAFTFTKRDLLRNSVLRTRKLVPYRIMGNSHSQQSSKRPHKKGKISKKHSMRSLNVTPQDKQPSSTMSSRNRKRQHKDDSSVGSRLSGNYDDISVLSSQGVMTASAKHKDDKDTSSEERIKSPRLSVSPTSETRAFSNVSHNRSIKDLLAYKPSLKTEFDFRDSEKHATSHHKCYSEDKSFNQATEESEGMSDSVIDSTLSTLKGVCCAISSLQGKINETIETPKSRDHLNSRKYTGKRHPSVSPSYPILSTRTPMSPAESPYNSPGPGSPAELCLQHEETNKVDFTDKINQHALPANLVTSNNCTNLTSGVSSVSTTPATATVSSDRQHFDMSLNNTEKSSLTSTIHEIMSSKEGFEGSLLESWLLSNSSDLESKNFVEQFCDSLVRSRLLVIPTKSSDKMAEKENVAPEEKSTIFNRLKFMPSQIYTWGPFSRIRSATSPTKRSTYKDFARRQVEINPTLSPSLNQPVQKAVEAEIGPSSSEKSASSIHDIQQNNVPEIAVKDAELLDSSSTSLLEHHVLSPESESVSEDISYASTGTNSSKKLGNVWPPPRPEEEDTRKLKYTEAEHQHELMVLKRNHTDELYKITKDYETNIYEMNEEHTYEIEAMQQEANMMRQEIAFLKGKLNADKHDASTQTQNVAQLRLSKGIQVNLSGELLPPPPQITLPTSEDQATSTSAPPPPPPPPPPPAPGIPPPPPPIGIPPPPPPIGGPPPPPGAAFNSKKDSPKRAPIEPRKPMKPLYWKRIQIPKKEFRTNKSVWVHIEDVPINEEEMEKAFCKTTTAKKSKALSDTIADKKKKIAPAKVLDNKRSQAVGIFISSLHVEMEELEQAILNLDTSVVDEENMKAIYDLRATKQEVQSIKAHLDGQKSVKEEEKQPLDKPEKFIYSLSQIDHFNDRMFCITFCTSFQEDIHSIQKELRHMNSTLQELQDKDTVLRVLGLVLSVGNYLNGGNRTRGQADGFQLDILSKLKDVKGQKDNTSFSLLNYIAWVYMRSFDQDVKYECRVCPLPTFQSIVLASQVNFADIAKELKRVSKELKDCDKRVTNVLKKAKTEYIEPFKNIMETFLQNAYSTLEKNETELLDTQTRYKESVEFFCMKAKSSLKDSKTMEPKEFFGLWQTFCMDFHAIWKVEVRRFIKEEQQKAKKQAEEVRERQMATTVVTTVRRRPNSLKSRLMNSRR